MQIEGRKPVEELFASDLEIDKIYIEKGIKGIKSIFSNSQKEKIDLKKVSSKKINKLAKTDNCQGIIAVAEKTKNYSPEDILKYAEKQNEPPFIVILDQIQDPHNLGAVIRTAYAAGVHGVIFPRRRACDITPAVIKASSGAALHLPLAKVSNINYTIQALKKEKLWFAAADVKGSQNHYECDLTGPIGIVIGNEGRGLRRLVRENCDFLLKIPMNGEFNSLNASVAAGIIIFEAVRQRKT